jgi:Bacterial regulatory proteins, luxR family
MPGKEGLDCLRAATEQRVGMAALRHALTRFGDLRDHIAIDDNDSVELFISPETASVHVSRILTKLGVADRAEAAVLARRANRAPRG